METPAKTLTLQIDHNGGMFDGEPIGPSGWVLWSASNCMQNPNDGTYYFQKDVVISADKQTGTATLIDPPNGWQGTPAGVTILSFLTVDPIVGPTPAIAANHPLGSKLGAIDPKNPSFFPIAQ